MTPSKMGGDSYRDDSYMTHLCSLFPDALKKDKVRKCAEQLHLGLLV